MDNNGGHDPKRQRVAGPEQSGWHPGTIHSSNILPPINGPPINGPSSPFRHDATQSSQHHLDRRGSDLSHAHNPQFARPNSGSHSTGYPGPPSLPQPTTPSSHLPFPGRPPTAEGASMKREPLEEQQYPQRYVPQHVGNGAPDHIPNAQRPERGYENSRPPYASSAPPQYHHPPHTQPPQSPMPPHEGYGQPYSPHALSGQQSSYVSYPSAASNSVKRKAQRAAQACDSCRTLKAKCDEGRPVCSTCKEKGVPCAYRDPPPKQQDKSSQDVLDAVSEFRGLGQNIQDLLKGLTKEMATLSEAVRVLEAKVASQPYVGSVAKHESAPTLDVKKEDVLSSGTGGISGLSSLVGSFPAQKPVHPSPTTGIISGQQGFDIGESDSEVEQGQLIAPGKSSIPVNHTTTASRLLLVGAIRKLTKMGDKSDSKIQMLPMLTEEKRGLLRLYGRGEGVPGSDRTPGYDRYQLVDELDQTTSPETPSSEAPSPPGEVWGQLGGLTPPQDEYSPPVTRGTKIDKHGMPTFARSEVHKFVKSYLDNINNMHPILAPKHLYQLVERFLNTIPERSKAKVPASKAASIGFLQTTNSNMDSPGSKRKRSSPSSENPMDLQNILDNKPGTPFRSINTALVLLVMALGEICCSKEKIAEFTDPEESAENVTSPPGSNGHPQSPTQSSPIMSTPSGIPSPQDGDGRSHSRRTSLEASSAGATTSTSTAFYPPKVPPIKARNLDRLPGLTYFAMATDIIGNQLAGTSLQHVHANILASLYHGQLGRVLESHAYLHNGCRTLQNLLRPKLERLSRINANPRETILGGDNPLVITFWTCLQLESDIIAELNCPMSNILNYEELMPAPNWAKLDLDHHVIQSYSGHIWLRKHLNTLHTMFYRPLPQDSSHSYHSDKEPPRFKDIGAVEENLAPFRTKVVPLYEWHDSDPPATDILAARLRAKYYGAKVITYRDYVLKILEKSGGTKISSEFRRDIDVPQLPTGKNDIISDEFLRHAELGIKALISSTTAFWNVVDVTRERLFVTNIWGTAHAQWGNVLVLLAAHLDKHLNRFIDEETITSLLVKTLAFLKFNAQKNSALYTDYTLLDKAGRTAGLLPKTDSTVSSQPSSNNSSFTNSSGGDVTMKDH